MAVAFVACGDRQAIRTMALAAKNHGAEAILMVPLTDAAREAVDGFGPYVYAYAMAVTWRRPNG